MLFNILLICSLCVLFLNGCDSEVSTGTGGIKDELSEDSLYALNSQLTHYEEIDTNKNVVQSYYLDSKNRRQGVTVVYKVGGDTIYKWYSIDNVVLGYFDVYKNNELSERQEILFYPDNQQFTWQGTMVYSEEGIVNLDSSCFVHWNYDLSKQIITSEDSIAFHGVVKCPIWNKLAYNYYLINHKEDTLYTGMIKANKKKAKDSIIYPKVPLKVGINRYLLSVDTKVSIENGDSIFYRPREYPVFVNRVTFQSARER